MLRHRFYTRLILSVRSASSRTPQTLVGIEVTLAKSLVSMFSNHLHIRPFYDACTYRMREKELQARLLALVVVPVGGAAETGGASLQTP